MIRSKEGDQTTDSEDSQGEGDCGDVMTGDHLETWAQHGSEAVRPKSGSLQPPDNEAGAKNANYARVLSPPVGKGLVIARIWRGFTTEASANAYLNYMMETGVRDLQLTDGNRGVYVLRRIQNGRAEFILISLWESIDAIRKFAGANVEKAVYYPEDPKFLLELDPNVAHFEVLVKP